VQTGSMIVASHTRPAGFIKRWPESNDSGHPGEFFFWRRSRDTNRVAPSDHPTVSHMVAVTGCAVHIKSVPTDDGVVIDRRNERYNAA
jgi:hypothetical protein